MKYTKKILAVFGIIIFSVFIFFFAGKKAPKKDVEWGANFSNKQARLLGLDPKKTYLATINDLGAKRIKLSTYWDQLEVEKNKYDFSELDWQIKKAEENQAEILLVVGMKTPRWPECHIPAWAENLSPKEKEERVRLLVKKVVARYEKSPAVWAFQIENEPFLAFGDCPERPKGFLKKEVDVARGETDKPIVISDSGEWSFWSKAARIGDLVATTIYRTAWFDKLEIYATYPLPPVFYRRKALLVNWFFGKKVICGELQAEPWGPMLLSELPRKEQKKTMDRDKFENIISYARRTRLSRFYLWGAEWWLKLKEEGDPYFFERARLLFLENK